MELGGLYLVCTKDGNALLILVIENSYRKLIWSLVINAAEGCICYIEQAFLGIFFDGEDEEGISVFCTNEI